MWARASRPVHSLPHPAYICTAYPNRTDNYSAYAAFSWHWVFKSKPSGTRCVLLHVSARSEQHVAIVVETIGPRRWRLFCGSLLEPAAAWGRHFTITSLRLNTTYIKSPRCVFITHAQPSHKSSRITPRTPSGTSRWVKRADPDVWHFSPHGSAAREERRCEWQTLGSVGLRTEPTRQRMSSEVLGSLGWRHVRACVTPSRGARVARRHWRGGVGSIVSAVDDIIPHQWRRARDERSRGEHAARAGCWWWGIKWANGGIINTMKIRKIDQTLRNLS